MATVEYWLQVENRPWDVSPNNIDRVMGHTILDIDGTPPASVTLISPETGVTRTRTMYKPLRTGTTIIDALIFRRYAPNWASPDDRKVNPWDLNEPDPTDNGTMGTIPGPVIECTVGDTVVVHLRNKDHRPGMSVLQRCHSLHPHGFVFAPTSDGAYPLSPPDPSQPVGGPPGPDETALWTAVGVSGSKKADRIPPGASYTYRWNTFRWPTTAGVWLYHDHSVCDTDNVQLGAIGIIVIHNPDHDPDDVVDPPLPGGSFIGSPLRTRCFPLPFEVAALPHDLNPAGLTARAVHGRVASHSPAPLSGGHREEGAPGHNGDERCDHCEDCDTCDECPHCDHDEEAPRLSLAIERESFLLELSPKRDLIARLCFRRFRDPPERAQYLQLYHNLTGAMMCVNGRKFLGNTPTVVAGLHTKMRFGIVGMGNVDGFHTFHLHGHRWVIPGPDGTSSAAIEGSAQIAAASQFEDTRTFGPANSFSFTINQGSFMGSLRPPDAPAIGEWHMHCHVLTHMMDGMMGSLLIVNGGELFFGLPSGEPCEAAVGPANTIVVKNNAFTPNVLAVAPGTSLTFDFQEAFHSVTTPLGGATNADPIESNGGGGAADPVPAPGQRTVTVTGTPGGVVNYHCGIHGVGMPGTIQLI